MHSNYASRRQFAPLHSSASPRPLWCRRMFAKWSQRGLDSKATHLVLRGPGKARGSFGGGTSIVEFVVQVDEGDGDDY